MPRCRWSSVSTRCSATAFEAAGGIDRVLRDTYVIVTSDHGHCEVLADARARRRSSSTVGWRTSRRRARASRGAGRDDIMICPNMRAAQIYVRRAVPEIIERIASLLIADPAGRARHLAIRPDVTGGTGLYGCQRRGAASVRAATGSQPVLRQSTPSAANGRGTAIPPCSACARRTGRSAGSSSPTPSSGSRACSIWRRRARSG